MIQSKKNRATWHRSPLSILFLVLSHMSVGNHLLAGPPGQAGNPEGETDDSDTPLVVVARPELGTGFREIDLPGSFEPFERALLFAKVTGYVKQVYVDIGDTAKRGEPLVELRLPEMKAEMARARADVAAAGALLRQAQANSELASITHRRLADLSAREHLAVIQQDVDVASAKEKVAAAKVDTAAAELDVARAELDHLKALMEYSVIRAPFDGMVAKRAVDPGALVVDGADGGKSVLEFARADRLRLVIAVPEAHVYRMKPGIEVRITVDALPERIFLGTVSRVAGALAPDTRTMRAEIDMGSEGGLLLPGMYATVRCFLPEESRTLTLPASLIRREEGEVFVWTVDGGRLKKVPIALGYDDGDRVVIEGGIGPDSLVVKAGPANMTEDQRVRTRTDGVKP